MATPTQEVFERRRTLRDCQSSWEAKNSQSFLEPFLFKEIGLMLSTYVDDLTLSGPKDAHEAFWAKLTKMINVEPFEPIFRVLGRTRVFIHGPAEPQEPDLNAAVSALKGAVAFDTNDYARQTVELFCSITGTQPEKLQTVTTPFCPDGSLPPEDDQ